MYGDQVKGEIEIRLNTGEIEIRLNTGEIEI
jgi:hypothetical protein